MLFSVVIHTASDTNYRLWFWIGPPTQHSRTKIHFLISTTRVVEDFLALNKKALPYPPVFFSSWSRTVLALHATIARNYNSLFSLPSRLIWKYQNIITWSLFSVSTTKHLTYINYIQGRKSVIIAVDFYIAVSQTTCINVAWATNAAWGAALFCCNKI